MQKVVDQKTGRKITVFNKYELNGTNTCPECHRPLDENDRKLLKELGKRSCKKCGAILVE